MHSRAPLLEETGDRRIVRGRLEKLDPSSRRPAGTPSRLSAPGPPRDGAPRGRERGTPQGLLDRDDRDPDVIDLVGRHDCRRPVSGFGRSVFSFGSRRSNRTPPPSRGLLRRRHAADGLVEAVARRRVACRPCRGTAPRGGQEAGPDAAAAALRGLAAPGEMRRVRFEGRDEPPRPPCSTGRSFDDRRPPPLRGREIEHHRKLGYRRSAPSRSALLTTKTSPISRMPALIAWMSSPRPGTSTTADRLRGLDDVHLVLPDTHRFDQDDVVARRVEHVHGVGRRPRQSPEGAARGHRADEDAGIRVDLRHPDPVSQDRPARERRRRVHGHDADGLAPAANACARRCASVDLPAPGGPVIPMTRALPVRGKRARAISGAPRSVLAAVIARPISRAAGEDALHDERDEIAGRDSRSRRRTRSPD